MDLLKMDIQCGELDCIRGATKCLENATHLIIEIVKYEFGRIYTWDNIKQLGDVEN